MSDEIIALDVGRSHVGVARASLAAGLPQPLPSLKTDSALEKLAALIKELDAGMVVVGLPRGLDGQETDQTKWVRQWATDAKKQFKIDFYWQDEALTSKYAEKFKNQASDDDHSLAAAIILNDFLNSPAQGRVLI